jgi:sigma-B regulation protein RsbQ
MYRDSKNVLLRSNPIMRGTGDTTVVLGHGVGTNQSAWNAQLPVLLAAGYRVLTYDFAGATKETEQYFSPRHHRTIYGFAEDLLVMLHALELHKVIYVGHSIGGMIGVLACLADPARFDCLVLMGASARYMDDPSTGYVGGFSPDQVETLLQAASENYVQWANGFAPVMVGQENAHLSAAEFTRNLLSLRPDVVHATLAAALRSDHRSEVEQLQIPLYVLQTSVDEAVPMAAAQWLATHGRARALIEIPTHGHLPHITAPDAVNTALLQCLQLHHA